VAKFRNSERKEQTERRGKKQKIEVGRGER